MSRKDEKHISSSNLKRGDIDPMHEDGLSLQTNSRCGVRGGLNFAGEAMKCTRSSNHPSPVHVQSGKLHKDGKDVVICTWY